MPGFFILDAGCMTINTGFIVADRGGVVRIAELQSQGYVYLRP